MRPIYDSDGGGFPCDGLRRTGWADARRRKNRQFASLARSTAPTDLRGRIERGLRDGGRRAGPSQGMSDMDGRALRASAITPDGRHPGRTARHPFWPFCGGRAARRISMHGKWTELVPMLCRGWVRAQLYSTVQIFDLVLLYRSVKPLWDKIREKRAENN